MNGNVESNGVSGWSKVWVCTPKKGRGGKKGYREKIVDIGKVELAKWQERAIKSCELLKADSNMSQIAMSLHRFPKICKYTGYRPFSMIKPTGDLRVIGVELAQRMLDTGHS